MGIGDVVTIGDFTFQFKSISEVPGPNYRASRGVFDVIRDGQVIEQLQPEKRRYFSSAMPMTEAAIDSGLWRDLYVSLGEVIQANPPEWSVRVYYKPFVPWLWAGVLLMTLARFQVPVVEYPPMQIKLALAGHGHADKADVLDAVMRELNLEDPPRPDDAADALAAARTGWFQR